MDVLFPFQGQFSWQLILILLAAGFLAGVINTFAGSGTVITYSLFMLLGLPARAANGTIRLGVIMQTLAASATFRKSGLLDLAKGLWLGVPTVMGTLAGALIAVDINENLFEKVIGLMMLLILVLMFLKPEQWIRGQAGKGKKKPGVVQFLTFFIIGVYGGFIHIGVGIFLLAGLVLNAGYDVVRANALKVFIVFLYSPFALTVFILHGQVHYGLGLIAAVGNLAGGIAASRLAIRKGSAWIRWLVILIIFLFGTHLLGLWSLKNLLPGMA